MAVVGIAQMWLKRENAAVLLRFCAVAMFATVIVNDEATTTSAVALVVIGIGIALFTTTPQLELAGYSTALLLALAFNGDSDLSNALPEAAVITALFIFGAGRLRQIIRNLIVNAQRYGRDPIRVVARGTGDTMMLEIRDSGAATTHRAAACHLRSLPPCRSATRRRRLRWRRTHREPGVGAGNGWRRHLRPR